MKTLLKNGVVVNVFTGRLEKKNVLLEGAQIIGVDDYADDEADVVRDVEGKYLCPGFIDGHIHIESTMLTPTNLAKVSLLHGTTSIVADPHEIANVCGVDGIAYMLESSKNLPLRVFMNLPSCVPATPFDESGAVLCSKDLLSLYGHERVVGLAEMMNYPGVLFGDEEVLQKIADAKGRGKVVDGHAPLLTGKALDRYISTGIQSDHECSTLEEAEEKISKGQWLMIREGTAARNLQALLPLFDGECAKRCLLVTDDRHPADLLKDGHVDHIIRLAAKAGKSVVKAIQMATLQAAQCFRIPYLGAIAPGYRADLLVLDDLESLSVSSVYTDGKLVVDEGKLLAFTPPAVDEGLQKLVRESFRLHRLTVGDFQIVPKGKVCRVIKVLAGQLLTEEWRTEIDWEKFGGVDVERDILKLAVIERHGKTGHKGLGFVNGLGLKKGAIASSVSHDSHNLIVLGANDEDMAIAANRIIEMGGGNVVVLDGKVIAEMSLPIAGLMSDKDAEEVACENERVRSAVYELGVPVQIEPFMNLAFLSLPVIPHLKMTPMGLVDVDKFEPTSLYVD